MTSTMSSTKTTSGGGGIVDILDGIIDLAPQPDVYDDNNGGNASRRQVEEEKREQKKARFDTSRDTLHTIPSRHHQTTGEELLAIAEVSASYLTTTFEPTMRGARLACKHLAKSLTRNRNSRDTYPNNPEKFVNDELALNDALLSMKNAAVYLNLYPELVDGGMMNSLLLLLHHDNVDIATGVLDVLVELLDPSILSTASVDDDGIDGREDDDRRAQNVALLANAFIDGNGLDLLSSNLGRLDESVDEDTKGVEDALTLVEYLLDLDRVTVLGRSSAGGYNMGEGGQLSVVACICEKTALLSWLFERVSKEEDDDEVRTIQNMVTTTTTPAVVRLHCAEVLSVILQHEDYTGPRLAALPKYKSAFEDDEDRINEKRKSTDDETSRAAITIDGMEILLLAIATYRKKDPQIEVQCEFLENVFGLLSASLLREDNVIDFVKAEGIELMLRCVRQKVHAGGGALRVLNFALSKSSTSRNCCDNDCDDDAYKIACETFVNTGGLKLLFPLYMARKSVIPCPAACSDGGSALAKKGVRGSKRARTAVNARRQWLVDVEQNVVNIMHSLTRHINLTSRYDAYSRLLVKFVEEDCEKCDRTIELCLKYDERARIAEYQYYRSDEADEAERLGIDVETAALGAKLRGGVDLFHCSCVILSFACVGSKRCRRHIMEQLKLQGVCISGECCYLLNAFSFLRVR